MTPAGRPSTNDRLTLICTIVLIGTAVSTAFHYVMANYVFFRYPWNTFLFLPLDHFNDFFAVYRDVGRFAGGPRGLQYSPVAHLLVSVMRLVPAQVAFALLVAAFAAVFVWMLLRLFTAHVEDPALRLRYVFTLSALSYPFLFAVDRGNLELAVFPFLLGFFYFYYREGGPHWAAYVCLGIAIAMKIYPATLLVLPLSDRRWRKAAWTAAGVVAAMLAATLLIGALGGFGFGRVANAALTAITVGQGRRFVGIRYAHSLYGALGVLIAPFTPSTAYGALAKPYLAFALAVFAFVTWYVMRVESEPWRKAALLMISALALPFISGDYTLIHLYPVLMLFLASADTSRLARVYAVLFSLLLIPLDYFYFDAPRFRDVMFIRAGQRIPTHVSTVSTSTLVYPAVMLAIGGLIVWEGLRSRRARAAEGSAADA